MNNPRHHRNRMKQKIQSLFGLHALLGITMMTLLLLCIATLPRLRAQDPQPTQRDNVKSIAKGTFDVQLTPVETDDKQLGMMLIQKTLQGDIDGTSQGRMLTAMTDTKGSAGYVAVERVTGKLGGASGTMMLQHSGTMSDGKFDLTIRVVPNSGTDGWKGIAGELKIEIVEGKHFYELEYSLPK